VLKHQKVVKFSQKRGGDDTEVFYDTEAREATNEDDRNEDGFQSCSEARTNEENSGSSLSILTNKYYSKKKA
jgi:hypothetical protein